MPTITTNARITHRSPPSRRGGASVFVLFAVPALMACVALALDIAMLCYQSRQMQSACDAAALAGVVELLDHAPLYSFAMPEWSDTTATRPTELRSETFRVAAARRHAQAYAARNAVGRKPLELDANLANQPDGHLVVGWVDEPQARGCPMTVWADDDGPINSLLVRGNRRERRGNAVSFWVGRLLGLRGVDLEASARATIDHRVHGFRPNGHVPVPLLPIVIHPNGRPHGKPGDTLFHRQASPASDRYSVDDRSGFVTAGTDGIDEIVLTIPPRKSYDDSANASLVNIQLEAPNPADLERQIVRGCNSNDLQALGGELAFGNGPLLLPVIELSLQAPPPLVARALLAAQGEKRIWLLGDRPSDSGLCDLSGFVAGRVVACAPTADAGLEVVVQPCVLANCTALVGRGWPHNPWIGKAMLSE